MQIIKKSNTQNDDRTIWTSQLINQALQAIEDGYDLKTSPFYEKDILYRKGNLIYEYTEWEIDEIKKCAKDVIYFANNYAYTMTDYGMQQITLRDYQEDVLKAYQANKEVVFMASRQIGKCQLFNSQIVIKNKNTGEEKTIKIYKLYKPKTFLSKLKHFFYNLYCLFD